MHKWAKQIADCVKVKVDSIGIENFSGQMLDDLKDFTEIIKNIACFDKDYKISEAMEEAEDEEEKMRMIERYEGYPTRRGYKRPEIYGNFDYADYPERMRDMDRSMGKMYYTERANMNDDTHKMGDGRSWSARRSYVEMKNTNKPKEEKLRGLDEYMKDLATDITELISDMTPEEKNLIRSKLTGIASKI